MESKEEKLKILDLRAMAVCGHSDGQLQQWAEKSLRSQDKEWISHTYPVKLLPAGNPNHVLSPAYRLTTDALPLHSRL